MEKNVYHIMNENAIMDLMKKHPQLIDCNPLVILQEFNEFMRRKYIVGRREGVALPYYIGYMFLGVFPVNGNAIDWKKRKFAVAQQDGFLHRVYFSTTKVVSRFVNARFWGFTPAYTFRDEAREGFRNDWKKYVVIPNLRYMKDTFRVYKAVQNLVKSENAEMTEYDEFAFN